MPKLWDETIEGHRQAVRDAALAAASSLVASHGLRSVTMSQIAEATGIGRATLYKYFPDVEAVLLAWHQGEIGRHLRRLHEVGDAAGTAGERLRAVLEAYASIAHESHGHHDADLASVLHRDQHVAGAEHHLLEFVRGLVADAAASGEVRDDIATEELATYCVHAITAARRLPSKAAVRRLVDMTHSALRPQS